MSGAVLASVTSFPGAGAGAPVAPSAPAATVRRSLSARSVPRTVRTDPPAQVVATPGPVLLSGVLDGPSLEAHRDRFGQLPQLDLDTVLATVGAGAVVGRGGAGFPFADRKSVV